MWGIRRSAVHELSAQNERIKRMLHTNIEPPAAVGLPLPKVDSSGDELFRMGLLYSTGQGGAPLDYVSAHMLFNLAAMRGSQEAKVYRKELSQEMDPADIAEAQRAARQWLANG
jgi:TPR repeat protein